MRALLVSVAVALIVVLSLSAVPNETIAQSSGWVNQSEAYAYVVNLLSWYNSSILPAHTGFLFQTGGHSYNVLVMRANPNSDNLPSFWFSQIVANSPDVSIDPNDTTLSALGIAETDNGVIMAHSIQVNHTLLPSTLVWTTLTSNVLSNGQLNSENAGKYLAEQTEVSAPQSAKSGGLLFGLTWYDWLGVVGTVVFLAFVVRDGIRKFNRSNASS